MKYNSLTHNEIVSELSNVRDALHQWRQMGSLLSKHVDAEDMFEVALAQITEQINAMDDVISEERNHAKTRLD